MRFRHIFSETFGGLRQNLTMTLAVVMTMWVSLSLFGAGLLANQQVGLMKGRWYDRIEISIFLCTPVTRGEQCDPGQRHRGSEGRDRARSCPTRSGSRGVYFESKQEAFDEFQKAYGATRSRITDCDEMQESFRVKLKNRRSTRVWSARGSAQRGATVRISASTSTRLQRLTCCSGGPSSPRPCALRGGVPIANTIRLAAFAEDARSDHAPRRSEQLYITLPFLSKPGFRTHRRQRSHAPPGAGFYFVIMRKAKSRSSLYLGSAGTRPTGHVGGCDRRTCLSTFPR